MGRLSLSLTAICLLVIILLLIPGSHSLIVERFNQLIHNIPPDSSPPAWDPHVAFIGDLIWRGRNESSSSVVGNSWCYSNDPSQCDEKGRYYSWKAAMSICPPPWHLPTINEWKRMVEKVSSTFGINSVEKELGVGGFLGFNDALAGYYDINSTRIEGIGNSLYWSATQSSESERNAYNTGNSGWGWTKYDVQTNKEQGLSVRCVKKLGPIEDPSPIMHIPESISWDQDSFTFTLIATYIGYGSGLQGTEISELNHKYGIDDDKKITVLNIQVEIHNNSSNNSSTAPFGIERVADEYGKTQAPWNVFTLANKSFTLGPGETIMATEGFLISDNDNAFLFVAGVPLKLSFTVSRMPVSGGSQIVVQKNSSNEDECAPLFLSENFGASLRLYKSCSPEDTPPSASAPSGLILY